MIVAMAAEATEKEIETVIGRLVELGFDVHRETGAERTVLACLGAGDAIRARLNPDAIAALPGVADAHRISAPYKLAARAFRREGTRVTLGGLLIGGSELVLLDPAAVSGIESESELTALPENALVAAVAAGSMHNRALLRALGPAAKPVLLERAPGATLEEWLLAAEEILVAGNFSVVLAQPASPRIPFDVAAIPELHRLTHLPVMADLILTPAHLTAPLARAAVAAGADALLLRPADLAALGSGLRTIRQLCPAQ